MEKVGCAVLFSCLEPESSQASLGMPRMRLRARRFSSNARRVTRLGRTQRTQLARCSTGCSGESLERFSDLAVPLRTEVLDCMRSKHVYVGLLACSSFSDPKCRELFWLFKVINELI